MPDLYTIGYEGVSQTALLGTLLHDDIETLVDIRELPQSRKPGLSKTALTAALESHGIAYVHVRALGSPRDLRHQRRIDHDEAAFKKGFLQYLATQDEPMKALVERTQRERCCLLCYEADPLVCHRLLVAERAVEIDPAITVTHLRVDDEKQRTKKHFPLE